MLAPSYMTTRLIICAADNVPEYRTHGITHILTIANPGVDVVRPAWFTGEHLVLYFGDVVSEADAEQCKTKAPTTEDIRQAVEFTAQAWGADAAKVLIHCDYGASRSPAVAYVALAAKLGPGMEEHAFRIIEKIRPEAVPNKLTVQLGDDLLCRNGALMVPLNKMFSALNDEIGLLMSGECRG